MGTYQRFAASIMDFLKRKTESYKKLFKKYGFDPRSLKWQTEKAAQERYRELVADLDFEGKTVLDIGCGFGDIIPIVRTKAKKFKYTGIDIVPEFISQAKKLHPGQMFMVRNFVKHPIIEKFDIVMACGSLNSNIENNLEFRKKIIKKMFEIASYAFVFNMAGSYPPIGTDKKSNIWYANSMEILKYCMDITPKIIFRSHYNLEDFTVVMFK